MRVPGTTTPVTATTAITSIATITARRAADEAGESEGAQGLGVGEEALRGAETDEDFGHAEEEALEVELEEFPGASRFRLVFSFSSGSVGAGQGRGGGQTVCVCVRERERESATHFSNVRSSAALCGRMVREVLSSRKESVWPVNAPLTQSTSPPRTRRVSASLVFTTAHHCTAVLTSPPQVGWRLGEGFSSEVHQDSNE